MITSVSMLAITIEFSSYIELFLMVINWFYNHLTSVKPELKVIEIDCGNGIETSK